IHDGCGYFVRLRLPGFRTAPARDLRIKLSACAHPLYYAADYVLDDIGPSECFANGRVTKSLFSTAAGEQFTANTATDPIQRPIVRDPAIQVRIVVESPEKPDRGSSAIKHALRRYAKSRNAGLVAFKDDEACLERFSKPQ